MEEDISDCDTGVEEPSEEWIGKRSFLSSTAKKNRNEPRFIYGFHFPAEMGINPERQSAKRPRSSALPTGFLDEATTDADMRLRAIGRLHPSRNPDPSTDGNLFV